MTKAAAAQESREVASLQAQFEAARAAARELTDGLPEEAFNWRTAPGTWSVAECLDHLNVSGRKYLRSIDRSIDDGLGRGLLGTGPFRYGLLERWFVRSMEPPPMFRAKSPKAFVPAPGREPMEVVEEFAALQDHFQRSLARAEGLDLGKVKTRSPVSRYLKFSLGQAFTAMAAHQRRHLWQARNVRAHGSFPTPLGPIPGR